MEPASRKLHPGIALLLSLVVLGLGQLYNGQGRKALALYAIMILLGVLGTVFLLRTFTGLAALVAIIVLLAIVVHVDAFRSARALRVRRLPWFSRWPMLVLVILVYTIAWGRMPRVVSSVHTYRLQTSSMTPTLQRGDFFMAERVKAGSTVLRRGDLVVFEVPDTGELWTKRIIGLEGEEVRIRDRKVFVNGRELEERYVEYQRPPADRGALYRMDNLDPVVVPPGTVFVMGDARDVSRDSRHFGPIPVTSIRARPLYCYLSLDAGRIGRTLQ